MAKKGTCLTLDAEPKPRLGLDCLMELREEGRLEEITIRRDSSLKEFRAKLSTKRLKVTFPAVKTGNLLNKLSPYLGPIEKCSYLGPAHLSLPIFKTVLGTRFVVDAFKRGPIDGCKGYFLSHFHSDHYDGLSASWNATGPIYCSAITARLVQLRLKVISKHLKPLDMNRWISICDELRVFLVDANHCPGSVMFLFHKPITNELYLHCGDCRAGPDLLSNKFLLDAIDGRRLDVIYLDTTYCNPAHRFPCQVKVIEECAELVKAIVDDKKQVRFSPIKRVVLVGSYVIGKERIALRLAEVLDSKIYVAPWKRAVTQTLDWPSLTSRITDDPTQASVHLVPMGLLNQKDLSEYLDPHYPKHHTHVLAIRPTGWTGLKPTTTTHDFKGKEGRIRKGAITIHSVPYSEHSSFGELEALLSAFPADIVIPTVGNDWKDVFLRSDHLNFNPEKILLAWFEHCR